MLLKESSSVYQRILLFKSSFKRLIFALLEQINVCSQPLPRVSFRHVRYSTTKFASIREVNGQLFRYFLLASWQIRRLSYRAPVLCEVFSRMRVSRRIYTGGIPDGLSVYAHTMSRPGSGPDSSQHIRLLSAKALLPVFLFNAEGIQLYGVFRSDNLEKSLRKNILS